MALPLATGKPTVSAAQSRNWIFSNINSVLKYTSWPRRTSRQVKPFGWQNIVTDMADGLTLALLLNPSNKE